MQPATPPSDFPVIFQQRDRISWIWGATLLTFVATFAALLCGLSKHDAGMVGLVLGGPALAATLGFAILNRQTTTTIDGNRRCRVVRRRLFLQPSVRVVTANDVTSIDCLHVCDYDAPYAWVPIVTSTAGQFVLGNAKWSVEPAHKVAAEFAAAMGLEYHRTFV